MTMASNSATVNSGQQQQQQQSAQPQQQLSASAGHFQQPNSAHHCKECGLFFDSAKSLEVHLQYHKENLLNKWANQAAGQTTASHLSVAPDQETNNNNSSTTATASKQQQQPQIKREFSHNMSGGGGGGGGSGTIAAAADSSDSMLVKGSNKSPDSYNSRTTPETSSTSFGHPPTPQSYHSAPSPYQSHADQSSTNFSPGYQGQYQPATIKSERTSPSLYGNGGSGGGYLPQHMYSTSEQQHHHQQQQYFSMEQSQQLGYPQDYPVHKIPGSQNSGSFRYHPYGHHPSPYERSPQVSSSSPAYPSHNSQPTPSPSPKQCDKCGCVCDSAAQLIDHLNHAHPPTPSPAVGVATQQHLMPPAYQQQQFAQFPDIKQEMGKQAGAQTGDDEPQTEILDLDSHKVHHVFQSPEEEEEMKRNGELAQHSNPHSVTAMLGSWPGSGGSPTHKMFTAGPHDHRPHAMFAGLPPQSDQKHPAMFQPHPAMHPTDYIVQAGVTTSSQDATGNMLGAINQYRPFEHLPPQPNPPVISSTQLPGAGGAGGPPAGGQGKGANWKSNEARRPKTYNCSACNKWFTSSGHLKRHYNTTLHKNAVKSSGQPDPATMPISAHHHPGREERGASSRSSSGAGMSGDQRLDHSPDSAEDVNARAADDMSPASVYDGRTGGMLQQPPSGPYDRQPALSLGPGPPLPGMHSPSMHGGSPGLHPPTSLTNLSSGSPPNGEAGPSASQQDHLSRGLLSISTLTHHNNNINTTATQHQVTSQQPQLSPMDNNMCTNQQQEAAFSLFQPQSHHLHHMMAGTGTPLHSPPHSTQLQDTTTTSNNSSNSIHQPLSPFHQSMQSPGAMAQNYPNESAPHVMPATATNSQLPGSTNLTIIGDQYGAHEAALYGLVGQPQQPVQQLLEHDHEQQYHEMVMEEQHQPLPSFAQFQTAHHRYGILLTPAPPGYHHHHHPHQQHHQQLQHHPANVGGAGPVTDSLYHHHPASLATALLQQHHQLPQQGDVSPYVGGEPLSPAHYQDITVLESAAQQHHQQQHEINMNTSLPSPYSPPSHNNNVLTAETHVKPLGSPPEHATVHIKSEPKHDYEHGSPQITSTGSPLGPASTGGGGKSTTGSTNNCGQGPNGQHKCFDCDKVFNKACYLTQHNKTFHSGDKPFKCHRCGKRFPSDPSYQEHLAKHAGDKPYKCELCPKQFNHKTDLRRHMCLHTGQKPYACEHCGKGFIRKDHMLKHAETHTRKTHHHAAKAAAAAQAAQAAHHQHHTAATAAS